MRPPRERRLRRQILTSGNEIITAVTWFSAIAISILIVNIALRTTDGAPRDVLIFDWIITTISYPLELLWSIPGMAPTVLGPATIGEIAGIIILLIIPPGISGFLRGWQLEGLNRPLHPAYQKRRKISGSD